MSNYTHLKQEAFEANMQLPALNLVLFTFGNVSVADRSKQVFAIKDVSLYLKLEFVLPCT